MWTDFLFFKFKKCFFQKEKEHPRVQKQKIMTAGTSN